MIIAAKCELKKCERIVDGITGVTAISHGSPAKIGNPSAINFLLNLQVEKLSHFLRRVLTSHCLP